MGCQFKALSYLLVHSSDLDQWQDFGQNIIGAQAQRTHKGDLLLKLDERDYRVFISSAEVDRLAACGWEVSDASALERVKQRIHAAGIEVEQADRQLCQARQVQGLILFTDPSGNRHEVSYGYSGKDLPFRSELALGGFVTGSMGMGHVALPAPQNYDQSLQFFTQVLGFGISDVFDFQSEPDAPVTRIRFLYADNARHHSIALAEMPHPAGCIHAMLEVSSMSDVGKAHDRMQQAGIPLMATLGQHENDRMTSFYMMTPGQFALEYGFGGITIDPGVTATTRSDRASIWGHDFSVGFA